MYSLYVLFIYINVVIVLRDVKPTKLANDCCGIHIDYFAENKGFFSKNRSLMPQKQGSCAKYMSIFCDVDMGLLWSVESIKLQVFLAKEPYKRDHI